MKNQLFKRNPDRYIISDLMNIFNISSLDNEFPEVEGDKVIQIGNTVQHFSKPDSKRHKVYATLCSNW